MSDTVIEPLKVRPDGLKEFTIPRSRWARGDSGSVNALLRESDQKMCCLGIFGAACGIPTSVLAERNEPSDVADLNGLEIPEDYSWLVTEHDPYAEDDDDDVWFGPRNTEDAKALMGFNDDRMIADATRERIIAEKFLRRDYIVKFVD